MTREGRSLGKRDNTAIISPGPSSSANGSQKATNKQTNNQTKPLSKGAIIEANTSNEAKGERKKAGGTKLGFFCFHAICEILKEYKKEMVLSLKELQSTRRNGMPFVLAVPKTTLSFNDLLEGFIRFRKIDSSVSQLPIIMAEGYR